MEKKLASNVAASDKTLATQSFAFMPLKDGPGARLGNSSA
jgi:hypothetical protein